MADARAVLDQWLNAIEARDLNRIIDLLADDVTIETEMIDVTFTGTQTIRELLAGSLDAYESISIEPRKVVASGNDVAIFARVAAHFGRDLELYGETLPTAGKSLEIAGAIFAEVNDEGKITRLMRVRDSLGVVQQLGIEPDRIRAMMQAFEDMQKRRRAA